MNFSEIELTTNEKQLASALINRFGSAEHPVCNEHTLGYFRTEYVDEIIKDNDVEDGMTATGTKTFNSLKRKLKNIHHENS